MISLKSKMHIEIEKDSFIKKKKIEKDLELQTKKWKLTDEII